jgi:hypothetical protein
MSTSAPERSRPITVQIAVVILAVSVGIGMVKLTLGAHLDNPLTYLLLVAVLGVSHSESSVFVFWLQALLQLIAAVALFLPQSGRWFQKSPNGR